MAQKEDVIEALKTVEDPELQIDVWTLGLIYDVQLKGKQLKITMTFTSPMCPFGPMLVQQIKDVTDELGLKTDVEVVFDPPWKPSEDVKEMLGIA